MWEKHSKVEQVKNIAKQVMSISYTTVIGDAP